MTSRVVLGGRAIIAAIVVWLVTLSGTDRASSILFVASLAIVAGALGYAGTFDAAGAPAKLAA